MTLPSRKTLLANGISLLLLAWLYGGDLSDGLRARTAEVSAFTEPPSVGRPAVVLTLTVLALCVGLWGLLRRRTDTFKGYRLLPIVLVGALFVDLVFAERKMPLGSTDLASMSLQYFSEQAQQRATRDSVPADPALLSSLMGELGRPPYLIRGQPAQGFTLQVRQDCEGPVSSAPGLQPGTLIYCVAPERKGAWITLVGLPAERRFGTPDVLSVGGEVRFMLVQPLEPEGLTPEGEPFREAGVGLDGGAEP
ncbi:hypothetical protein [Hyalangium rubrum]|uniref:TIGR03943 family protein n=1 Tax=Hyalangium rubrum TaxID=3103134 RepID=A0ABU5H6U8_9BACT|nr:hypothetical protein [Hyalangium sp. s54d21]MDY7228568.1 hypothetical protein [Hyalangium sp. s54d21]